MPYFHYHGVKLFYRDEGSGPLFVFLHCWTGNHTFWQNQTAEFSTRFRCLAPDFPGHGFSEKLAHKKDYSPESLAHAVQALLNTQAFKNKPFIIAGHSLGGMVALQVALLEKERTKALILANSSAHLRGQLGQNVAVPVMLFLAPVLPPFAKRLGVDLTAFHPLSNPALKFFVWKEINKVSINVTALTLLGISRFNARTKLSDVQCPALILQGTADLYTDIRHGFSLKRGIPQAHLAFIPRSGHMSILEQPGKVNKAIKEFLQKEGHV